MHKQAVTRGERMILAAVLALAGGCQLAQMQVSPPLDGLSVRNLSLERVYRLVRATLLLYRSLQGELETEQSR